MMNRRHFLRQANCALISSVPILNTLLNLRLAGTAAAAVPTNGEYRALVCLFLVGGNDSFNMLVPRGASEHAAYAATRANLALARNSLLPITPTNLSNLELGLHPSMGSLQNLFETGKAAFIANVGTLVEPVSLAQFNAATADLPLGLFSHSDQIEQWQTSTPEIRSSRGWGGRAADLLQSQNSNSTVSMNISLNGNNVFQSGQTAFEYAVAANGATSLDSYRNTYAPNDQLFQARSAAVDGQLSLDYKNLLSQGFSDKKRDAIAAYQLFNNAVSPDLPTGATFPATELGNSLRMVAKAIAGRSALGHTRQTFFVTVGGWDMHDEVLNAQNALLPMVSNAVASFYNAMELLNVQNQVTLFSASDFGRSLTSNGDGTDHGWGGNQFVVGGAVQGRKIYGQYPDLSVGSALDVGRGRLIPTTAVDLYFAELALWLGVPKSQLPLVLPNIARFYSPTSSSDPLGFLA